MTAAGDGEQVHFASTFDDGPAKTVRSAESLAIEADGTLRWGEQRFTVTRSGQQLVARSPFGTSTSCRPCPEHHTST